MGNRASFFKACIVFVINYRFGYIQAFPPVKEGPHAQIRIVVVGKKISVEPSELGEHFFSVYGGPSA